MRRLMVALPYIAGVLVCLLTIQLGLWQLRRADEKTAIGERLEAAEADAPIVGADVGALAEWTRVELHGHWLADKTILLDNRVHAGRPGFHVLTPLALENGQTVLIRRGWVVSGRDRSELPVVETPDGTVRLVGRVRIPEARPYSLAAQAGQGRLWQYLDLDAYDQAFGVTVAKHIVEQTEGDDSMVRDWPRPDLGIDRHLGYAAQWFGLAALAAGLVAWFGWRRWQQHGNG